MSTITKTMYGLRLMRLVSGAVKSQINSNEFRVSSLFSQNTRRFNQHFSGSNSSCDQKLSVGQTIVVNKAFPFEDVRQFAALSHDTNPLHLNEEYAAATRFGQRVVHGVLVLGFVSGVLGTKMPGIGTILISHDVHYPNPTFIGDTVSCKAVVKDIRRGRRVCVHVVCTSLEENHVVLEGDFNLLVTKDVLGLVTPENNIVESPDNLDIPTDRQCR